MPQEVAVNEEGEGARPAAGWAGDAGHGMEEIGSIDQSRFSFLENYDSLKGRNAPDRGKGQPRRRRTSGVVTRERGRGPLLLAGRVRIGDRAVYDDAMIEIRFTAALPPGR